MPAPAQQPWVFTQLAAPGRVLKLDGPNAPFGRPRKSPVAEKEIEVRQTATYYFGQPVPDRHVFGHKQSPITLVGRFMDARIGVVGGALEKADNVAAFVADSVVVSAEWGGYLAMTGLLTKFKAGLESPSEIPWSLTFEPDSDDVLATRAPDPPAPSASSLLQDVTNTMLELEGVMRRVPVDITYQPSLFDAIAGLISSVNEITGSISSFADSVDNFESTLSADVHRFKSGMLQVARAVQKIAITLESAENDAVITSGRSESQVAWFAIAAKMNIGILAIMEACEQGTLAAEIALGEQFGGVTVVAHGGDTWESLARAYLGSSSRAQDVRSANHAPAGSQPMTGQKIHMPSA